MFSRSRPCFGPDCTNIDLLCGPLIYEKIYSRVTLHATSSTVQTYPLRISNAYFLDWVQELKVFSCYFMQLVHRRIEKGHLMKSLLVRLNAAYGEKNTEFGLIKKLRKIKDRF
jgi:hypothetical protein